MLRFFRGVIEIYGLLLRVCLDKGGENVMVVLYMFNYLFRGFDRGSYIAGRSVYN